MTLRTILLYTAATLARSLQMLPWRQANPGPYVYVEALDRKAREAIAAGEVEVVGDERVRLADAFDVCVNYDGPGGTMGVVWKTDMSFLHPRIGFWTGVKLAVASADARKAYRTKVKMERKKTQNSIVAGMKTHYLGKF